MSQAELRSHEVVHLNGNTRVVECNECGYRTADRSKLIVHQRTHNKERPFACK
jgi:NAD-dependent SIR2 family protein deacetylase